MSIMRKTKCYSRNVSIEKIIREMNYFKWNMSDKVKERYIIIYIYFWKVEKWSPFHGWNEQTEGNQWLCANERKTLISSVLLLLLKMEVVLQVDDISHSVGTSLNFVLWLVNQIKIKKVFASLFRIHNLDELRIYEVVLFDLPCKYSVFYVCVCVRACLFRWLWRAEECFFESFLQAEIVWKNDAFAIDARCPQTGKYITNTGRFFQLATIVGKLRHILWIDWM